MAQKIVPMDFPVERQPVETAPPRLALAKPGDLFVDAKYQRAVSGRSARLIEKMVAGWDWRKFKPPIVVVVDGEQHVLDGQHTAIAAASHGAIEQIPILIVEAPDVAARARAFVGHNKDRVNVTPIQIHHAALAAGDEDALTVSQVCERSRVRLLRMPPPTGRYEIGDTMSLTTIRRLIDARGAAAARQTLDVLVDARCAPIGADYIKATAELLFGEHYRGSISPGDLATVIRGSAAEIETETRQLGAAKRLPFWRALVIILSKRRPRRGYRGAA